MRELTEIRWHARAGQGAKSAAQVLALATVRSGKSAQAFPEYGPERRGAPLRAFTRISNAAIRRHDAVTEPTLVVVLEPSLLGEVDVVAGLAPGGRVLVNADVVPAALAGVDVRCIPASRLAAESGSGFANVTMVGAAAAELGEPSLEAVQDAVVEVLGGKADRDALRAAVEEGYAWPT